MKAAGEKLTAYLNTTKYMQSCDLYEFVLKTGVSYYYADTDTNVVYGGHTYVADGPVITRTQIKLTSEVSVDKLTVTINATEKDTIGGVQIIAVAHNGGFEGARVRLRRAFFENNVIVDVVDLFNGYAEVKQGGGMTLQLEVKSVVQKLNAEWPQNRYYPLCPYSVYSEQCGLNVSNYRQRVAVTSVPAHNTVTVNTSVPDGYYDAGGIEWLSGPLVGQSTQILRSQNGQLLFMSPSEAQPEIGNEAFIYPGCDKTADTCRTKFNNFSRNRATPYVPRKETIR